MKILAMLFTSEAQILLVKEASVKASEFAVDVNLEICSADGFMLIDQRSPLFVVTAAWLCTDGCDMLTVQECVLWFSIFLC